MTSQDQSCSKICCTPPLGRHRLTITVAAIYRGQQRYYCRLHQLIHCIQGFHQWSYVVKSSVSQEKQPISHIYNPKHLTLRLIQYCSFQQVIASIGACYTCIMFEIVNMGESHECYKSETIEQLSRQMSFYYCLSEPLELNIQFLTNHTFSILIKREHSIQIETCFSAKNKPDKHTSFSDLGHGEFQ